MNQLSTHHPIPPDVVELMIKNLLTIGTTYSDDEKKTTVWKLPHHPVSNFKSLQGNLMAFYLRLDQITLVRFP